MADSARFALVRQELRSSLESGEQKILELLQGSAQHYAAGQVLVQAEKEHPNVYRVVRGWACRSRALSDGRDQSILIFLPGDLFAVKSMFVQRHPDAVRTLTTSVLERIDHQRLHEAFRAHADIADRCIWQVMEEERRLHNWVVGLGVGSAEERLSLLLMDLYSRLRETAKLENGTVTFELPLTQTQLAEHLGVTPIHVNRLLRSSRESNVAIIRDGFVRIIDVKRLVATAWPLLDPYQRMATY